MPPSQIETYLSNIPEPKQSDMRALHSFIEQLMPDAKRWYLDGRNEEGKVIANPTIGYGNYTINYADGKSREFFQVGLLAHTTGISIHILGIADKKYLPDTFGKSIGKASVTGYCIKFKKLADINLAVLEEAIRYGVSASSNLG